MEVYATYSCIEKFVSEHKAMTVIFIECGITMSSPFNTGIQRVVRNILHESKIVGPSLDIQCIPVIFVGNDFYHLSEEPASSEQGTAYFVKRKLHALAICIHCSLSKIFHGKLYLWVQKRIKHILQFLDILPTTKTAPINLAGMMQHASQSESNTTSHILLLLDSTWDRNMWDAVEKFRTAGGHASAVLYDLIPFSHPETVAEQTRETHTAWWSEAPLHLDSIMCISQAVRDEFFIWQQLRPLASRIPPERIGYFYLGSELRLNTEMGDAKINLLCSDDPYLLVVGSLEPRKNHGLILDAFEQLWQAGHSVNLAIVGGHGWKCEALLDRINQHTMLNKKLFLIRDATDSDLILLYSKTSALIMASIAEGFGLPIVEAFQRGVRVICSDIPVFKEIAGEHAKYFDPSSSASLASVISESVTTLYKEPSNKLINQKTWISWKESAEQLFSGLMLCVNSKQKWSSLVCRTAGHSTEAHGKTDHLM
jgi:glycosyltransferase involved in cell wall biosynthesis